MLPPVPTCHRLRTAACSLPRAARPSRRLCLAAIAAPSDTVGEAVLA